MSKVSDTKNELRALHLIALTMKRYVTNVLPLPTRYSGINLKVPNLKVKTGEYYSRAQAITTEVLPVWNKSQLVVFLNYNG